MSQYPGGSPSIADELTQITSYVKELRAKHPSTSSSPSSSSSSSSTSRKAPAGQQQQQPPQAQQPPQPINTPPSPVQSSFPQTPAIPPDVPFYDYSSPPMRFVLQPDASPSPLSSHSTSSPRTSPISFSKSRLGLPISDSKDLIEKIRKLEKEKSFYQDSFEDSEKEKETLTANLKAQIMVLEREMWNIKSSKYTSSGSTSNTTAYSSTPTYRSTPAAKRDGAPRATKVPERPQSSHRTGAYTNRTATTRTTSDQSKRTSPSHQSHLSHHSANRTYINAQHSNAHLSRNYTNNNNNNHNYPPTTPYQEPSTSTNNPPHASSSYPSHSSQPAHPPQPPHSPQSQPEKPQHSYQEHSEQSQQSQQQSHESYQSHHQSQHAHHSQSQQASQSHSHTDNSNNSHDSHNIRRTSYTTTEAQTNGHQQIHTGVNTDFYNNNNGNTKNKYSRSSSQPHYRSPIRSQRPSRPSATEANTKYNQYQSHRSKSPRPRSVSAPRSTTAPATLTMRIPAPDPPFLPSGKPQKTFSMPANIQKALAMLALAHVSFHHSSPRQSSPPRPCTRSSCASSPPHTHPHAQSSPNQSHSYMHGNASPFLDLSYATDGERSREDEEKSIALLLDSMEKEATSLRQEAASSRDDSALPDRIARKEAQIALLREFIAQRARMARPTSPLKTSLVNEKHLQAIHILHSLQDLHSQQ